MPGAPSEWCPDWYITFEQSQVLRVPPWELEGFTYDSAADAPVCWKWWAAEFFQVKSAVAAKERNEMLGRISGGG